MPIYTRTGDDGYTKLFRGGRVSKNSPAVNLVGDLDELIAWCTLTRQQIGDANTLWYRIFAGDYEPLRHQELQGALKDVIRDLYIIKWNSMVCLTKEDVSVLEATIDVMEEVLPPLETHVQLFSTAAANSACVARAVCRRVERSCVACQLFTNGRKNECKYINRLSDFLFTVARYFDHMHGYGDQILMRTSSSKH